MKHLEALRTATSGDGDDGEEEGNKAFRLRQEERAIEETRKVFGPLGSRVVGAVGVLGGVLVCFFSFVLRGMD